MSNINEVLMYFGEKLKRNIHTCIPCEVVAVNNDRVDVVPIYKNMKIGTTKNIRMETGEYIRVDDYDCPALLNCPVCMLVNSVAKITIPISVGDQGLLVISEKDIRNWKEAKGKILASARKFDMNDGFFIPFINQSITGLSTDSIVIDYKGTKIEVTETKIEVTGDIEITGDLKVTGALQVTGEATIGSIPFSTHKHAYISPSGPAVTGVPQP